MLFPEPLHRATLRRRYKRFLADAVLEDGAEITAHCANPGAMTGLNAEGAEIWLSPNRNPKAKLDWRLELVHADGGLVGINTAHPNGIVAEAVAAGRIPELAGYDGLRREVKYGRNSRIDILLEGGDRPPCYVEVKNVHLRRALPGRERAAEFPDAVTARGAKHLAEMSAMVGEGARAVMVYLVQRGDCDHFRLAEDIDPTYATALAEARTAGVEALCVDCDVRLDGIEVRYALPLVL